MNAIVPVSSEQLAIEGVKRLVNIVMALKNEVFQPGVDFGVIPGTDKPTLLQPGMEKLLKALHLRAEYVERSKIEDFDKPLIYYRYECRLIDWETGICVGTAIGSANSHESKWNWRWLQEHELPAGLDKSALQKRGGRTSEFAFAINKAETTGKYGKPAEYWQMFTRAIEANAAVKIMKDTKSGKSEAWEIDTTVYRIPNPDLFDQMNTIDKIAQKRALGSAIKTVANVSMLYTVDLEDFQPYETSGTNIIEGKFTVVDDEPLTPAKPVTVNPTPGVGNVPPQANPASSASWGEPPSIFEQDFPTSGANALKPAPAPQPDDTPPNLYHVTEIKVVTQGNSHMYLLKAGGTNIALYGGDKLRAAGMKPDYWKGNPGKWFSLKPHLAVTADQDGDKWIVHTIEQEAE